MRIEGFGYSIKSDEQANIRKLFGSKLKCKGKVQLKDMNDEYRIFLDYGENASEKNPPVKKVYFLRFICDGGVKGLIDKYTLKKRIYLGPTSMDTELSFIMNNMVHSGKNREILDPFVGTGSILVSSSYYGGNCYGIDIDMRILRGKLNKDNKPVTIYSNFDQYGLKYPELIRADFSRNELFWNELYINYYYIFFYSLFFLLFIML